ncbi:phage tail assembly protein [Kitasatospora sp. NBC_00070]|uniref:phage tail assembly protein n=1 Tax=Kitasatospora sp. NBC_00070 TaxID=2975962 RepID=UPI003254F067
MVPTPTTLEKPLPSVLSCSDLLAEVEREYTGLPLETRAGTAVTLRNLLLLPAEGLASARAVLAAISDAGDDLASLEPKFRDLLLLVADQPKTLAEEMADWPLGLFVRVVTAWQEATQLGEASDSES